jgi:hypothetical protein
MELKKIIVVSVVMVAVPAVSFVIGNKLGAWLMADAK